MTKTKARVLALYLPQFHPIPENDKWWGKGFTEWTNVGKAKRYFPGHYQPRVPADIGYYDLRVPETRVAQASMAHKYGIEGFIYWHYWFGNGKRLLERPFNEVLSTGLPDFPFALAWANESWKGFWHGLKNRNVLIEQQYLSDDDYVNHFNTLLPAFKDTRYITCEGKPLFFLFKPKEIPNVAHFIEIWQKLAKNNGFKGIHFVGMAHNIYDINSAKSELENYIEAGFDSVNFQNLVNKKQIRGVWRISNNLFNSNLHLLPKLIPYKNEHFMCPIDYDERAIPNVVPNWDHTPRTGRQGSVIVGSNPEKFRTLLQKTVDRIMHKPYEKRFITIKSWNEWAEGNYLEPDLKYGHAYLEAVQDVILN